MTSQWSVGLFKCGDSAATCCLTCCLPCVTFGRIAHTLDDGQSSCFLQGCIYAALCSIQCQWVYSCMIREKMRNKYGLAGEPCSDCCVHFCCEPCALCQEHAELEKRGLNPSGGNATDPPIPPSMNG